MRGPAACLVGLAVVFTADVYTQTLNGPRNFLVIVDDLHLDFRNTARTRDLIRRTLRALIRDGDLVSMVSTGESGIAVSLTADQTVFEKAIKRIAGNGLSPTHFMEAQQRGIDWTAELRHRANRTFSVATEAVRAVELAGNGPATVLYFTNGYLTSLVREPTELIEAALPANAAIYAIDPRFLGSVPSSPGVTQADWDAYVSTTQDSLRMLARLTGGRAIFTVDEWDEALRFLKADGPLGSYFPCSNAHDLPPVPRNRCGRLATYL
jgi:hypothetical protein